MFGKIVILTIGMYVGSLTINYFTSPTPKKNSNTKFLGLISFNCKYNFFFKKNQK